MLTDVLVLGGVHPECQGTEKATEGPSTWWCGCVSSHLPPLSPIIQTKGPSMAVGQNRDPLISGRWTSPLVCSFLVVTDSEFR